jgi:uncharacterized membrane protein
MGLLRDARVRWLVALLFVSLAVNLFLGGVLAGRSTGQAVSESQTRRSIQAMLAPLPEAERDLVRKEIGLVMPKVRERFEALQRARALLAQEMVKPTADSAALERAFAEVQTHTTAIGADLQQAIARALPRLTQAQRQSMVQALARRDSSGALPLP